MPLFPLLLRGCDTSMPTPAIAAYVQELRKGRGFTQESLAEAVGMGKRTIERLERCEGDISVEPFERIVAVLRALPDDVHYLVTNASATPDEGKEMAQMQLQHDLLVRRTKQRQPLHQSDPSTLGLQTYVRVLREQHKLSRKALADASDLPIGLLADWESGRTSLLPPPALVRALVRVGGTLDDVEQIATAPESHTTLAQRLAEQRFAALTTAGQPPYRELQAVEGASSLQRAVARKVVALEGLIHVIVGVLQRAFPTEAAELERSVTLWFQTRTTSEE